MPNETTVTDAPPTLTINDQIRRIEQAIAHVARCVRNTQFPNALDHPAVMTLSLLHQAGDIPSQRQAAKEIYRQATDV